MRFGSSTKWGNSSLCCILEGWVIKPRAKISGLASWKACRQMDTFCLVLATERCLLCQFWNKEIWIKIWGVNWKIKAKLNISVSYYYDSYMLYLTYEYLPTMSVWLKIPKQIIISPTFILPPLWFCFYYISFYLLWLYYFYTMELPMGKVVLISTKEWKKF